MESTTEPAGGGTTHRTTNQSVSFPASQLSERRLRMTLVLPMQHSAGDTQHVRHLLNRRGVACCAMFHDIRIEPLIGSSAKKQTFYPRYEQYSHAIMLPCSPRRDSPASPLGLVVTPANIKMPFCRIACSPEMDPGVTSGKPHFAPIGRTELKIFIPEHIVVLFDGGGVIGYAAKFVMWVS